MSLFSSGLISRFHCTYVHYNSVLCQQIEGLLEDVDFSTKVTREDLESMCADLFDRVGKPVTDALNSADITMVTDVYITRIM